MIVDNLRPNIVAIVVSEVGSNGGIAAGCSEIAAFIQGRYSASSYAVQSGVTGTCVIITANLVARALEPAHAALVAEREPARVARRVGSLSSNRCVQERRPALQVAVIIVPPENARGAKSGRVVVGAAQVELSYQCAGIAGMGENLWRGNFIR